MKKIWLWILPLLLAGCGSAEVFEPVEDQYLIQTPQAQLVSLEMPEEAAVTAMGDAENVLYFCDGYVLSVQTLAGGDLDRSFRQLTGYGKDRLTVLKTGDGETDRYECAWSSTGETGDQVGRLVLLDDGTYHYAVSVMAEAEAAGALQDVWEWLLGSVTLADTAP